MKRSYSHRKQQYNILLMAARHNFQQHEKCMGTRILRDRRQGRVSEMEESTLKRQGSAARSSDRHLLPKARPPAKNGTAEDRRALPDKSKKLVGAVGPPTPVISCPNPALPAKTKCRDRSRQGRFAQLLPPKSPGEGEMRMARMLPSRFGRACRRRAKPGLELSSIYCRKQPSRFTFSPRSPGTSGGLKETVYSIARGMAKR